jgi:transcriptional regulator with XRE-family HTH domain
VNHPVAEETPAGRLFEMRVQAGLTGVQLAERLGWQTSKVSRLQNGRQPASDADIRQWVAACGGDSAVADELVHLQLDHEARHHNWKRRMEAGQTEVQESYVDLVESAQLVRHFETVYVPGILQTPDYARRILTEMVELHALEVDDVEGAVAQRMRRQQFLYSDRQFEFLIAESVLRWRLCSAPVMRAQLDRLQAVIGMSNVHLGVLPFDRQLPTAPQNAFQIYGDVAVVETFIGETTHEGQQALAYNRVLERLWNTAVSGEDARNLITQAAANL